MLRKIFPFFLFLINIIFNQQGPIQEDTHYYLKEWLNEEGLIEACLLEGDSMPPESIPEGFIKVSLEDLHKKGYLTAEEQLRMLTEKKIPIETLKLDNWRWATSWAHCWEERGLFKYVAGSATWSGFDEKIRVRALRIKRTSHGTSRDWGYATQAHAGLRGRPAAVTWRGQNSTSFTNFLEVDRILHLLLIF